MEARREEFDPGHAPVYPLPQRDPMRALADWGAPPDPPIMPWETPGERPWESPGPPPWASRAEQELAVQHGWRLDRRKTPAWALVSVLIGAVLALTAGIALLARFAG